MASYLDEKTLLSLGVIDPEFQAVGTIPYIFHGYLTILPVFGEN